MSVLVSVLMPVLNEEKFVLDALASVLGQVDVDVEVLVVDGKSADRTAALVSDLAARDPRVRLLTNDKTNIPSGLNLGLAESRGQYIARVDGHSTVTPDYLSRAVRTLQKNPAMAGVGGKKLGVSDSATGRSIALALSSRFGVGNSVYHYGTAAQLTDHASFGVYRADVVRAVEGWDESLPVNEDVDFDHRIGQLGHVLGFDPQMQVRWRVRDSVPGLFLQYRRYGRGKAAMIRKNGRDALRLRHAVPPAAVVLGSAVTVASVRYPRVLVLALPYLTLLVIASGATWRRRDTGEPTSLVSLPFAFVAMHAGWGLGFLEGYLLSHAPALASGAVATAADADPRR